MSTGHVRRRVRPARASPVLAALFDRPVVRGSASRLAERAPARPDHAQEDPRTTQPQQNTPTSAPQRSTPPGRSSRAVSPCARLSAAGRDAAGRLPPRGGSGPRQRGGGRATRRSCPPRRGRGAASGGRPCNRSGACDRGNLSAAGHRHAHCARHDGRAMLTTPRTPAISAPAATTWQSATRGTLMVFVLAALSLHQGVRGRAGSRRGGRVRAVPEKVDAAVEHARSSGRRPCGDAGRGAGRRTSWRATSASQPLSRRDAGSGTRRASSPWLPPARSPELDHAMMAGARRSWEGPWDRRRGRRGRDSGRCRRGAGGGRRRAVCGTWSRDASGDWPAFKRVGMSCRTSRWRRRRGGCGTR
ncbi:hypothetical protein QJS66_02005 [Kocuria rhizophila]|nr:hypothetical protein QJS66_02005 [Kocuria rhizophila]